MRLLRIPFSLALLCLAMLGTGPLAAGWVLILNEMRENRVWIRDLAAYAAGASAFSGVGVLLVLRGARWALPYWVLGGCAAVGATFVVGALHGSFAMVFYGFFMALFVAAVAAGIHRERNRSYFDPKISWFQGAPAPVPGVKCVVESVVGGKARRWEARASRLDREGAFLFFAESLNLGRQPVKVRFELSGARMAGVPSGVECEAVPTRVCRGGAGLGVQFARGLPDARKELGDLVERLKGEGYVA